MPTPEIIKAPTKEVRMLVRRLRLKAAGIKLDIDVPKETMGPTGLGTASMTIHPDPIDRDSVVYSFGVGMSAMWDLEMIRRFGVTVHAFDPSPESVTWATEHHVHDNYVFHPVGIAAHDGVLKLYPPPTKRTVHWSSINRSGAREQDAIEAPVKRLSTIAAELGHDRIDVLKIDIDGSEYEVVPDILASGLPIRQILLEVHHNFKQVSFDDTLRLVAALRENGYRIYDISRRALELSFLETSDA